MRGESSAGLPRLFHVANSSPNAHSKRYTRHVFGGQKRSVAMRVCVLRLVVVLVATMLTVLPSHGHAEEPAIEIPLQNRAGQKVLPPRPDDSSAQARAKVLFDAIMHDDPQRAVDVFFPRPAFLQVKAMSNPGRYYDRLARRFESDIHALHQEHPELAAATFERLQLARRGGFVRRGEEGNRLPYWASRHSFLHYRVGDKTRKFEVRVMITWGDQWYVIHLSEFK